MAGRLASFPIFFRPSAAARAGAEEKKSHVLQGILNNFEECVF
jgi:hypothetical protein